MTTLFLGLLIIYLLLIPLRAFGRWFSHHLLMQQLQPDGRGGMPAWVGLVAGGAVLIAGGAVLASLGVGAGLPLATAALGAGTPPVVVGSITVLAALLTWSIDRPRVDRRITLLVRALVAGGLAFGATLPPAGVVVAATTAASITWATDRAFHEAPRPHSGGTRNRRKALSGWRLFSYYVLMFFALTLIVPGGMYLLIGEVGQQRSLASVALAISLPIWTSIYWFSVWKVLRGSASPGLSRSLREHT